MILHKHIAKIITKKELYALSKNYAIRGRSRKNKKGLADVVAEHEVENGIKVDQRAIRKLHKLTGK